MEEVVPQDSSLLWKWKPVKQEILSLHKRMLNVKDNWTTLYRKAGPRSSGLVHLN